uniref:Variant surface glycoprotein 1125.45 n=1 Tax=Trypanosoma brucei TaxID=5691 RepID=A0A1J0R434_9TRYP|nr:variant surface glycoprotein 1125.45 [Trypanosoma brucei]
MISLKKIATATFIAVLATKHSAGNVGPTENHIYFNHLCALGAAANADIEMPKRAVDEDDSWASLQDLNLTFAPRSWFTKLALGKETSNWAEVAKNYSLTTGEIDDSWKTHWAAWLSAHKRLTSTDGIRPELKGVRQTKLTEDQAKQARLLIDTAVAEAAELQAQITAEQETANKHNKQSVKTILIQAFYGGKATESKFDETKAFSGATSTRSTDCEGTKANSGAAVLFCICVKDSNANLDTPCFRKQTMNNAWTDKSAADWKREFDEVFGHCPHRKVFQATSTAVSQLAANIRDSIKIISNHGYYGAIHGSDCDGQNTGGACVKFTNYRQQASSQTDKIPWLDNIEKLANELYQQEAAISKINALVTSIKAVKKRAYAVPRSAIAIQPTPTTTEQGGSGSAHPNEQSAQAEEKCKKIDKETECAPPCKWNTEAKDPKKKCTLSEESKKQPEKANQETGGKDDKTTNATGTSNSFIKTSPLLLAFLLF